MLAAMSEPSPTPGKPHLAAPPLPAAGDCGAFDAGFRADLDRLFRWRRDVRHFRTDPVPDALIGRLLAQTVLAPSVGLSQPTRLVRVDSPSARAAVRANFARANAQALSAQTPARSGDYARLKLAGLDRAPVQIGVFCDQHTARGADLGTATMPEMRAYSTACAVMQLWLAARAEGLGVGWVSILDPDRLVRDLDLPPDWRLIAHLCIGWPAAQTEVPELDRAGWERRAGQPAVLVR